MRNLLAALLALATFASPAIADPVKVGVQHEKEYSITVTGTIEVAPDGSVHRYTLDTGLQDKVRELVASNLNQWKFEPILVDGKPVIATTRLRLMLVAAPDGDAYRLKVDNVWFGEPTRSSLMSPPRYPMEAARAGLGARVFLVLKLDEAGNVVEAHPEQTSLSAKVSAKTEDIWRKRFEKASIESARHWKFDVAEIVGGTPQAGSVRVPVDFMMGGHPDQWHGYIPGPVTSAPWADQEELLAAKQSLDNGEMQPLGSRFRLKTDVIGAIL